MGRCCRLHQAASGDALPWVHFLEDTYAIHGVDPARSSLAVVRPDGYVGVFARLGDVARVEDYLKRHIKTDFENESGGSNVGSVEDWKPCMFRKTASCFEMKHNAIDRSSISY